MEHSGTCISAHMDMPSFFKFEEELYNAGAGKDGLIIDVAQRRRFNHGPPVDRVTDPNMRSRCRAAAGPAIRTTGPFMQNLEQTDRRVLQPEQLQQRQC